MKTGVKCNCSEHVKHGNELILNHDYLDERMTMMDEVLLY